MKLYELSYLISPELSLEETRALREKINAYIQKQSGVLGKYYNSVKRKLGYSIKDKKEGYLATILFQMDPDRLSNFEKKLKSENQILRYVILRDKPKKEEIKTLRTKLPRKDLAVPLEKEVSKTKKVEIQEFEKKLEEILEE